MESADLWFLGHTIRMRKDFVEGSFLSTAALFVVCGL